MRKKNLSLIPDEDSPRRLDFGAVQGCGGRRKELQTLLNYVSTDNGNGTGSGPDGKDAAARPASMWIEAEPGVGKSNLMQKFREIISTGKDDSNGNTAIPNLPPCICVQGKFEERAAASEPFAALSEAMAELVQNLLLEPTADSSWADDLSSTPSAASWAKGIRETLDTELPLLLGILPILRPLTEDTSTTTASGIHEKEEAEESKHPDNHDDDDSSDDEEEDAFGDFRSKEWRFERFRFAFRRLIRHICARLEACNNTHLVLLLDDLHWVDPDSLQIIKTVLEDDKRPDNFLLVAATRTIDQYDVLCNFRDALLLRQQHLQQSASPQRQQHNLKMDTNSMRVIQRPSTLSSINQAGNNKANNAPMLQVIGVTDLDVPEITEVLLELLQYNHHDDPAQNVNQVAEFAKVVKTKTQGNFFVVMQFLRLLEKMHHICYDTRLDTWMFDLQGIQQVDFVSENVSEVVAHNIEAIHGRRRSALMVAASFGVSQFDVSTIVHAVTVFEDESKEGDSDADGDASDRDELHDSMYEDPYVVSQRMSDMKEELSEAACDGFVEETSPGHYRFSHDRIRESAYSLLPSGDSRKQVHLRVGRQLRGWMDTSSELGLTQGFSKESLLLHAAKQSNLGADLIDDEWELLDLAELNYQAAELAARKAAFFSSMEYLQVGLSHLGETEKAWNKHYDLALKFSVALSRMQYCCGLIAECWETSEAVIQHSKKFSDKSPMYHTRILCLIHQERWKEALDLCLDALDLLGKPLPRRHVVYHAIRGYFKASKFIKNTPDEYYRDLPINKEEDFQTYVEIRAKMAEICWFSHILSYFFLGIYQGLGDLADGHDYPSSCYDTCGWGMIQFSMGDMSVAQRYPKLIEVHTAKHREDDPITCARAELGIFLFFRTWSHPIRYDLTRAEDAFRLFWQKGVCDVAVLESPPFFSHLFACGEPLTKIASYLDRYSEAAVDYNRLISWYINAPVHQAVLNLQGMTKNPVLLKGSHIAVEEETFHETCKSMSNDLAIFHYQFWSVVVSYHFRDYQRAKRNVKSITRPLLEDGPIGIVHDRVFYTGLVYAALFKETRKSKYRRRATAAYRQLKAWLSKGAVRCEYMCRLLEAEDLAASRKQPEHVIAAYDEAIRVVSEASLCHHHALALEMAGDFCASQEGNSSLSKQYLSAALRFYQQWGATGIVSALKNRHNNIDFGGSEGKVPSKMASEHVTETETSLVDGSPM